MTLEHLAAQNARIVEEFRHIREELTQARADAAAIEGDRGLLHALAWRMLGHDGGDDGAD